ncbi:MAG: hypothetical protein FWG57_07340 [Endomicrobia bacterium]|nr:hypothetical protein [Endomicrobiia bacterium]
MADLLKSKNSDSVNAPWKPTYKWMGVTAGIILVLLTVSFFVLNILLKPYMRERPAEITPWLSNSKKEMKAEQQPEIIVENGGQNAGI